MYFFLANNVFVQITLLHLHSGKNASYLIVGKIMLSVSLTLSMHH